MPGIYERDNINYGGMLGNAMAAKANYLKNRYDRTADIGRTWGNAVSNSGNIISDALKSYADYEMQREQRDYQAQEAAKQREYQAQEAAKRAQWQSNENKLQRADTMAIAKHNWEVAQAQKAQEKKAVDNLGYNTAISMRDFYQSQAKDLQEGDPKKQDLILKAAQQQAKIDDYEQRYPELTANNTASSAPSNMTLEAALQAVKAAGYSVQQNPSAGSPDSNTPISDYKGQFESGYSNMKGAKLADNKTLLEGLKGKMSDQTFKKSYLATYGTKGWEDLQKQATDLEAYVNKQQADANVKAKNDAMVANWTKEGDPLPEGYAPRYIDGVKQPARKVNGKWVKAR